MKLAVLPPAGIVMLATWAAPLKNTPAVEVDVRLTVCPPVPAAAGLPKASSNCTVIVPEATPAVSVWAAVVNDQLLAGGRGDDRFLLAWPR